MGSEDTGIDQRLLALADEQVKIPILGKIESLNVSVASGLLIYEVIRQRGLEAPTQPPPKGEALKNA